MSQSGQLFFYIPADWSFDIAQMVPKLLALSGASEYRLQRTIGPDQSWVKYQDFYCDDPWPEMESLGDHLPLDRVLAHYRAPSYLWVHMPSCHLLDELQSVVFDEIPAHVNQRYVPQESYHIIGEHHLITTDGDTAPRLIDRAIYSFSIWGYGTACDYISFEDMFFANHRVKATKARLEDICGKMKEGAIWDW